MYALKSNSVVKGYQAYHLELSCSNTYQCFPEPDNVADARAVVVRGGGRTVGHVLRKPAQLNEHFLKLLEIDCKILT